MSFDLMRRRREERLRRLREEQQSFQDDQREQRIQFSDSQNRSWEDDYWEDELRDEREQSSDSIKSPFFLKVVISMFMLSATYIIHHTETPMSNRGKQFVEEVMTRDFNFQGVAAAVEQKFGVSPAILPTLREQPFPSQPTWMPGAHQSTFLSPATGDIVVSFEQDETAVHIAAKDENVKSIDKGWVIQTVESEENGHTITILHSNGAKSTYAGLEEIQVAREDWVQPGQTIGFMKPGSTLRFSLQVEEDYIDPMSVITFE